MNRKGRDSVDLGRELAALLMVHLNIKFLPLGLAVFFIRHGLPRFCGGKD